MLSHVQLLVTPWAVDCQAPLSVGFPRQENWSGPSFPSPGDCPNPGIRPMSFALAGRFFTTAPPKLIFVCSVIKSCPALCNSMDCSTPGFPVLHYLPGLAQTHVHRVGDAIPSSLVPFCLQSFPASGSFPVSQLFVSYGQRIGVSASTSVLPVNIQGLFPLGSNGLIFLLSKGLSRVFSSTTVWKHQFFPYP